MLQGIGVLPSILYSFDFGFGPVFGELRKSPLWRAELGNCKMLGHRSLFLADRLAQRA